MFHHYLYTVTLIRFIFTSLKMGDIISTAEDSQYNSSLALFILIICEGNIRCSLQMMLYRNSEG